MDTSGIFTLTSDTYDAMVEGIRESSLAKTHREVISLARTLGIRYLWIDALCIIQHDAADWERESKTLARVYGNAALTVIAGRSAETKDGFSPTTSTARIAPPPCLLPVDADGSDSDSPQLVIDLRRTQKRGPVFGKGWCF